MSLKEILDLPPKDRLEIAEKIWNSLDPNKLVILDSQQNEIEQRIASDKAGQMSWHSLEKEYNKEDPLQLTS